MYYRRNGLIFVRHKDLKIKEFFGLRAKQALPFPGAGLVRKMWSMVYLKSGGVESIYGTYGV